MFIISFTASRLSEYVEHYEPLEYDADVVHTQHKRTRRSIDPPDLHISFRAHEKDFKLRLRRDLSAFSEDFKVSFDSLHILLQLTIK